jgi:hypothetical protein
MCMRWKLRRTQSFAVMETRSTSKCPLPRRHDSG